MKILEDIRRVRDAAATRKAIRHLDNRMLRDIGLPERASQMHNSVF